MPWEQLADAVKSRRTELGLTQAQVAELGDLSVELLRMVENNRAGRLSARKARGLERALGWEPGSVAAILGGGSATLATNPVAAVPAPVGPPTASPGDRFGLARRVLALRDTIYAHQGTIGADAHAALTAELIQSAREAEESIIRIMPWLPAEERGQAIDLLVELRKPL